MKRKILKNKPLIEAIFELRWELYGKLESGKERIDPYYKVLIGAIYRELKESYPFLEPLPAADVPERFSPYVVQHQFRKSEGGWPLIQMGPGVVTLNDTAGYVWEDFQKGVCLLVDTLFRIYPEPEKLTPSKLALRYIDGIEFDYNRTDIYSFLKDKIKTELGMYQRLFENTGVEKTPEALALRLSFASSTPRGILHFKISRGTKAKDGIQVDALIWETMVDSFGNDVPKDKEQILEWLSLAHNLSDDWFFKIIEGDLERRFE